MQLSKCARQQEYDITQRMGEALGGPAHDPELGNNMVWVIDHHVEAKHLFKIWASMISTLS